MSYPTTDLFYLKLKFYPTRRAKVLIRGWLCLRLEGVFVRYTSEL